MKKLNHTLRWGGFLGGKLVRDVTLKAPDSGICLKLEGISGIDAITHRYLAECTEGMNLQEALQFWGTVKVPDAEEAMLELLMLLWPGPAEEAPQRAITLSGDIDENVIIDLSKLERFEDAVSGFTLNLKDGFMFKDQLVKQITGEVYTLDQSIEVQKYNDRPVEKSFRIIAMTCKDSARLDKALNLKHVQTMTPRDRKRIEKELEEGHQIVDFMIKTTINNSKAFGRVNLIDFL